MDEKTKVLLVDDEEKILRRLKEALQEKFDVHVATSTKQAIQICEQDHPDIIVTDVRMPNDDGLQIPEYIKHYKKKIPVIIMSGHADKEMAIGALKMGVVDFLEKPIKSVGLIEAIEKALGQIDG